MLGLLLESTLASIIITRSQKKNREGKNLRKMSQNPQQQPPPSLTGPPGSATTPAPATTTSPPGPPTITQAAALGVPGTSQGPHSAPATLGPAATTVTSAATAPSSVVAPTPVTVAAPPQAPAVQAPGVPPLTSPYVPPQNVVGAPYMTHQNPFFYPHTQFPGYNPAHMGMYGTPGFAPAPVAPQPFAGPGMPVPPPTRPAQPAAAAPAIPPAAIAFNYNTGPANNKAQWHHAFGRAEKFDSFRLKNLGYGVFQGGWDAPELLVYAAFYGRMRALRANAKTRYAVTIFAIGEAVMDCLPDDSYLPQDQARVQFVLDVKNMFPLTAVTWLRVSDQEWTDAIANGPLQGQQLPATRAERAGDEFDLEAAYTFLVWAAPIATSEVRRTELILWTLVSMAKQGNISDRFTNKIVTAVEQEIGVSPGLPTDAIQAIWDVYGPYIDEITAPAVFNRWLKFVPPNALRVQLTLIQTAGEGLTAFSTILKAMKTHPRFNWTRIANLYPAEWSIFMGAVGDVGTNVFYGYKKDLGRVRSTMYKNLGYVAKELMVKVSGDAPLNLYAGWTRNPAFRTIIDAMVTDYEVARAQEQGGVTGDAYLAAPDPAVANSPAAGSQFPTN